MRPRKPYRGVLRRRQPAAGTVSMAEWCMAWHERLVALAAHYELDHYAPNFGLSLAVALAEDHVEGFQIAKAPGARADPRQVALDIALCWEVYGSQKKGQTAASAYRRIVDRQRARGLHANEATLRKRFSDLKKPGPAAWRMWRMLATLDQKKL